MNPSPLPAATRLARSRLSASDAGGGGGRGNDDVMLLYMPRLPSAKPTPVNPSAREAAVAVAAVWAAVLPANARLSLELAWGEKGGRMREASPALDSAFCSAAQQP